MKQDKNQPSEYIRLKLTKVINLIRYMGLGIIILLGLSIILNQQTRVRELENRISENS